jgi:pimeloyl-ACP methyl ester carboxylesterase
MPDTLRDTWIHTPNGRLFARVWRSGRPHEDRAPIVLFHDSLGCVELWRRFPEALRHAAGRTVIAYDRLGFGRSDPFLGDWGPDFIRREADTTFPLLRAQLGLDRFVAFGHSVGGAMAAHVAAAFPSACRALITESAQAFVEDRTLAGIREAKAGFQQAGQLERLAKYHGDKARWVLEAWTETWLAPAFRDWTLDAAMARVTCPTLVIHGELDEYGSVLQPQRIGRATAGAAEVAVLPGRRHVPHREDEAAVLALIDPFLRSLENPA